MVKAAFEDEIIRIPIADILPLRAVPETVRLSAKYAKIARSIAEVGVIEPIVVARPRDGSGKYLLLDGHSRHAIMVGAGETEIACLVATDDEAFTYNKRVNRMATIQEHYMIRRALGRGVSEEKLAKALDLDIRRIRRRRTLLEGISPEAIDLLKDKSVTQVVFDVLRKMKPFRQMEVAELMVSAGNYTASYAKALLAGTRQTDLVQSEKAKKVGNLTPEQMDRMEREMSALTQDFKAVEASYGDDVLHLVIASGYLNRLISNPAIAKYLKQKHPELLSEFKVIVAATSLEQAGHSASIQ